MSRDRGDYRRCRKTLVMENDILARVSLWSRVYDTKRLKFEENLAGNIVPTFLPVACAFNASPFYATMFYECNERNKVSDSRVGRSFRASTRKLRGEENVVFPTVSFTSPERDLKNLFRIYTRGSERKYRRY